MRVTRRKRSLVLRISFVLIGLFTIGVIALVGAGLYAARLAGQTPEWWAGADAGSVERAPERARLLEQGITTALHERRESDEPWTVRMTDEDVNAWLEHRLDSWLENRSMDVPSDFEAPRMRVQDGRVTVGINSPDARIPGVLAVEFTPAFTQDGRLIASDRSFSMGRLPLPSPELLGRFSGALKQQTQGTPLSAVFEALLDSGGSFPSDITLSDRRRVRLQRLDLREDGSIDLTLDTARPD